MDARDKLVGIALLFTYRGRNDAASEGDRGLTGRDAAANPARRADEVTGLEPANDNMAGRSRIHMEKRERWLAMAPSSLHVLTLALGGVVDEILAN